MVGGAHRLLSLATIRGWQVDAAIFPHGAHVELPGRSTVSSPPIPLAHHMDVWIYHMVVGHLQ